MKKVGFEPKVNKNLAIANRLRVSCAHNTLMAYIGLNITIVELFDVEYYRDLEMWVRDHSRSLNVVPFESLGTVSYDRCYAYGRPYADTQRLCIRPA